MTVSPPTVTEAGEPDVPDRPPPPARRLRHALEATGVGAAAHLVRLLPRPWAVALGGAIGRVMYYLLAQDRRVARENLDLVFGDTKTPAEKARLARRGFQTYGGTVFGMIWAPRLTKENVRDFVVFPAEREAVVREALGRGRGVVFVTAHYGDWELMSLAVGFLCAPLMNVAEPLRNPAIDDLITRSRVVSGHSIVRPRFAVLRLFRHLRRGGSIGMLIDVNGRRGRGGVWLDFFGLPVFNSPAAVELALRADAAILFLYAKPLPGGRIELVVEPEIMPSHTGDRAADVRETSQRCLDQCASLIRAHPEHWLWTYKRWKRRPTPDQGRFPSYSKYDPKT